MTLVKRESDISSEEENTEKLKGHNKNKEIERAKRLNESISPPDV